MLVKNVSFGTLKKCSYFLEWFEIPYGFPSFVTTLLADHLGTCLASDCVVTSHAEVLEKKLKI
jgi:hypothetical protein